jgi:hypothetical protein
VSAADPVTSRFEVLLAQIFRQQFSQPDIDIVIDNPFHAGKIPGFRTKNCEELSVSRRLPDGMTPEVYRSDGERQPVTY